MKNFLLVKIRLSTYFWLLGIVFLLLSLLLPNYTYESGTLTLFSVNSFLYGFYISPILSSQKSRIEELHKIIRSEANALFSLVLHLKKLPEKPRNELQAMVSKYIHAKLRATKTNGEKEYEELITYCVEYKGEAKDQIDKVLEELVDNQQNRTNFSMQLSNRVYANEWQIMFILFAITLGFILTIDISTAPIFIIIQALLCTGLTMLIVILIKLNTLTHKKAKQMWQPLRKLVETNFYRID